MAKYTEKCPHCGNVVEGKKMRSDKNITTRNKVKEYAPMVSKAAGGAFGKFALPVGGGLAGSMAANELHQKNKKKINGFIDKVGDIIEDTFYTMKYDFFCTKCGHGWERDATECKTNKCIEENDHTVNREDYIPEKSDFDYENGNIYERDASWETRGFEENELETGCIRLEDYRIRKIECAIRHYCVYMIYVDQPENELDYEKLVDNINNDTDAYVTIDQIKADTKLEVCNKLFDILSDDINLDFDWCDLVMELPHGDNTDKYNLEVYDAVDVRGRVDNFYDTLIGINTSGSIEVGDRIIICTTDDKYYSTYVDWIEKDDEKVDYAESGEMIGLGVEIDLSTIPGIIDCVYKADEMEEDYKEENDEEMDEDNDKYSKKEIEKRILNIISEHLNEDIYDINRSTQLVEDLEVDSLDTVELIMTIEKEFNLIISDKVIKEVHTVGDIIDGIYYVKNTQDLTKFMFDSGDSVNESDEEETGLTPEEQEYIDEYKEIISEGEISARNQRYLAMLRETNGISDERAKELEAMVNNLG